MDFEVVVVGGGLAGGTAALFSARHGRPTLCLESAIGGGQLLSISRIEDYPGFADGVAGFELCPGLQAQAMDAGAEYRTAEVEALAPRDDAWVLTTEAGDLVAGAVIVATGSAPRKLDVPGEDRLAGHGVSRCASCDGPLYREQTVVVIGAGDSALQEALTLADAVGEVIVLHRGDALTAQAAYREPALAHPKISVRYGTVVEEVLGDDAVSGVRTRDVASGDTQDVELGGLFIYVGLEPNSEYLRDLVELEGDRRIPTDAVMQTKLAGVFAAGIVRRGSLGQAAISAGEGAAAAKAAHRYLDDGSGSKHESTPAATAARGNGGSHG
jgi:thioredoxin reductase (NADPH)